MGRRPQPRGAVSLIVVALLLSVVPGTVAFSAEPGSLTVAFVASGNPQGSSGSGAERAVFEYVPDAGDLEQIFNVFTVFEGGVEVGAETYQSLFAELVYEGYIRPMGRTSVDNVVVPESRTVDVGVTFAVDAPPGDYTLAVTSYDVTGVAAGEVSLAVRRRRGGFPSWRETEVRGQRRGTRSTRGTARWPH